jgi:SagB-type dehydrogenase family enzyme
LEQRLSERELSGEPASLATAAQLLWAAQGITRGGKGRTAPSAGAHYPIELYLLAGRVTELASGVYHYRPHHHDLIPGVTADHLLVEVADACFEQTWIAGASLVVVITAVFERTTVEYGERGNDYVLMEVGSVYQNLHLQAAALGLGATVVGAFSGERITSVLGLPENHLPQALMPVGVALRWADRQGDG